MVVLDLYLRELLIQEAARSAQSLSYILSDQTDRSLQSVFSTVSKIVDRLQGDGVGSVAALRAAASANDMRAMLLEGFPKIRFSTAY